MYSLMIILDSMNLLVSDMFPNTGSAVLMTHIIFASHDYVCFLQVRKKNVLKDFVSVAGLLHVSHFVMFTKTDMCVYMRLCRLPRGPTLTFKVHDYCLTKDVISSLRKPNLEAIQFLHHPLLVMNNFSGEGNHMKLMATMFQNLFPSINVHKVTKLYLFSLLTSSLLILMVGGVLSPCNRSQLSKEVFI